MAAEGSPVPCNHSGLQRHPDAVGAGLELDDVGQLHAPNQAIITGRNTTIDLSSPSDPITATNLPFDASGNVIASRSLPRNAGLGVANAYRNPRTVQAQIRFSF